MTKRVLVTGGAGFIGSHLVHSLVEMGHQVTVVDDLSGGKRETLNPRARFYQVDICSPELSHVFHAEKPQVIYHCAARVSVTASVREPERDFHTNVLGTINLLQSTKTNPVEKLVYSSTGGAIYGEPKYLPCDEGHPISPLSPYGLSKYVAEEYIRLYHRLYGLPYTILRYSNVYGPRQDPHGEAGVIAIFAERMVQGKQPTIFGSGQQERDFIYVSDVARANILALEGGKEEVYNIGAGRGTPVNEIFAQLKSILEYKGEALYQPARPGEVYKIHLSSSKAQRELGWRPQVSLEEGLKLTADYFSGPPRTGETPQ